MSQDSSTLLVQENNPKTRRMLVLKLEVRKAGLWMHSFGANQSQRLPLSPYLSEAYLIPMPRRSGFSLLTLL